VKKLAFCSVVIFFTLLSLQKSYDEKEQAVSESIELNEEILAHYESLLSDPEITDDVLKYRYYESYRGFLNWVTETEYKELDDEFRERLE
jgi:hypothetical protein